MNYNAIDLSLPSGTKWCDRNIGASSPEDAGLYFAWGETKGYIVEQIGTEEEQKNFRWPNYKFGNAYYLSKYTAGDNLITLDLEDDAAHINMGNNWKMPTWERFKELLDNTTSEWVSDYNGTGTSGRLFVSKVNNNKIFIPSSYFIMGHDLLNKSNGGLWTSSLALEITSDYSNIMAIAEDDLSAYYASERCYGLPIRGII